MKDPCLARLCGGGFSLWVSRGLLTQSEQG